MPAPHHGSNKQQIDLKNSTANLHAGTPSRHADRPTSDRSTSLVVAALFGISGVSHIALADHGHPPVSCI
ncbi:hypothetical protein HaLaN_18602 [Haematococcus lacustris]|uniref:Uncharacterized protein n=1 Tax=Haematococcus lacustris TaxID=44745 RepID=A0A699ZH98_HAELA|nr:hypothetical protein HaLaN_18602 [Haematococcus lacustris]